VPRLRLPRRRPDRARQRRPLLGLPRPPPRARHPPGHPDIGIAAGRIARRWYRAKGLAKTITVQRVEQSTGRVTYRRSTVRKKLFAHGRGFVCVNDGAAFASQLARYLTDLDS